jgi:hypothetical protein
MMPNFSRDPAERITVADARDIIAGRRLRRFAYSASNVTVFPRPSRAARRLGKRLPEIAAAGFGTAWLALPRTSTVGLLCLVAAVAAARLALEKRRVRR